MFMGRFGAGRNDHARFQCTAAGNRNALGVLRCETQLHSRIVSPGFSRKTPQQYLLVLTQPSRGNARQFNWEIQLGLFRGSARNTSIMVKKTGGLLRQRR
jgi:hypothetical protein